MNEGTRLFPEDSEPRAIKIREPKHKKGKIIAAVIAGALVCVAGFMAYNYRLELGSAFGDFLGNTPFAGIFAANSENTETEPESSESSESSKTDSTNSVPESSLSSSSVPESSSVVSPSESENGGEVIIPSESEAEPVTEPVQKPLADPIPRHEWYMLLVNAKNPLPESFSVKTRAIDSAGHLLDERAYDDFNAMIAAGEAEGLRFTVSTAYRTYNKQAALYNEKYLGFIAEGYSEADAEKTASAAAAKPGTSEHNSGLAIDIVSAAGEFSGSAEQAWLLEHAYEYGFILRYPEDKTEITGFAYEPWHYRYVGKEQAKLITESGLCLEEYLIEK